MQTIRYWITRSGNTPPTPSHGLGPKRKRGLFLALSFAVFGLLPPLPAFSQSGCVSIQNQYLGANICNLGIDEFDMGTSSGYASIPNTDLVYEYIGVGNSPGGTSDLDARVDGTVIDAADSTLLTPFTVNASDTQVSGTQQFGPLDITTELSIVLNPETDALPDTMQFTFTVTNPDSVSHCFGLRFLNDVDVDNNDGTYLSTNNGASYYTQETVFYKNSGTSPTDWWDYSTLPEIGPPALVGHGYMYNNPYDTPATEPDILEFAGWPDVWGTDVWALGPAGSTAIQSDSAVVCWWINGTDPTTSCFTLPAGQSMTFTTYYGLNEGALLTTPTPVNTPTVTNTPTITNTPTATFSPTISFTPTVTPTITLTPGTDLFYVSLNLLHEGGQPVSIHTGNTAYPGSYSLRIYNSAGELIKILDDRNLTQAADFWYQWDGTNTHQEAVASGIYLIYLRRPLDTQIKKILVIH